MRQTTFEDLKRAYMRTVERYVRRHRLPFRARRPDNDNHFDEGPRYA